MKELLNTNEFGIIKLVNDGLKYLPSEYALTVRWFNCG